MIVIKISDGFGNQMFQYACGYAQSRRLKTELVLDASVLDNHKYRNFELDKFHVPNRVRKFKHLRYTRLIQFVHVLDSICRRIRFHQFKEAEYYVYDERINSIPDNTYLSGYWQNIRYFLPYREDLLRIFSYEDFSDSARVYLNQIQQCNSVSVHIRRGDYKGLGICVDSSYYCNAIDLIRKQVENPFFFVFSDEPEMAEEIFKSMDETAYCVVRNQSENSVVEDVMLMTKCRHNINANSTYSWWGAWLNQNADQIVICPEVDSWRDDFYPESWIKVKCGLQKNKE